MYCTLAILTHFPKSLIGDILFYFSWFRISVNNYYENKWFTALLKTEFRLISIAFKSCLQKIQHHHIIVQYIIVIVESETIHKFPISWQNLIRFNSVIEKMFVNWTLIFEMNLIKKIKEKILLRHNTWSIFNEKKSYRVSGTVHKKKLDICIPISFILIQ